MIPHEDLEIKDPKKYKEHKEQLVASAKEELEKSHAAAKEAEEKKREADKTDDEAGNARDEMDELKQKLAAKKKAEAEEKKKAEADAKELMDMVNIEGGIDKERDKEVVELLEKFASAKHEDVVAAHKKLKAYH